MISRLRLGLAVLVIMIVAWLGWGLYSVTSDIRHALNDDAHDFRDNSEFYLSQYERELSRLIMSIQDYHAGDAGVTHGDLLDQLDIFWSRVNVYDQGQMGQYVTSVSNDGDLKADSLAVLVQTENGLLENKKRNPVTGAVLTVALKKLLLRYHDVVLTVNGSTVSYKSRNRTVLATWLDHGIYGLAGLSVAVGMLIIFLYVDLLITSRRVREIRKAQQQAENANRAKSEFLSSMSHEIRTPMTGVIGFADMLMDEDLPKESRQKVQGIKRATRSLLRLINDILDMSRLEAGKLNIELLNFNLKTWMDDIFSMFDSTHPPDQSVELVLDMDPGLPSVVNTDPTRLRQILVNIVGNALKFTHDGKVVVRCTPVQSGEGRQGLRFDVQDTGIGMSAATVQNLFGEFFQADASISRRYEGSGLGLAICRKLIDMLGGEIGVESEPGKGSKFWFTVPCDYVVDLVEEEDVSGAPVPATVSQRSLDVLVAEDNRVNQIILQKFLEAWGHKVTMAENGVEAVQFAEGRSFDLVLMDIRMPEMNGLDATAKIRALDSEMSAVPIIAVTADAMADQLQAYRAAGMNDCVTKPIDRAMLSASIDQVLAGNKWT